MKEMKREAAEALAKYFLRTGRGHGLISHLTDIFRDMLEGTVYLFAIKGLLGVSLPAFLIPVIVIVKKIGEYFLGRYDEKVGFWKVENEYNSRNINPFNEELLDTVKHIETMQEEKK